MKVKVLFLLTTIVFLMYGRGFAQSPPVLATIGPQSTDENVNLEFVATATDADGTTPVMTSSVLPTGATYTDNLNGTGTFDWTPDFTQSGSYSVTFYATDDSLAIDSELVTITVNNTNRAPVLANVNDTALSEGETLVINLSATDADSDSLYFSSPNLPNGATILNNGGGTATFSWSPPNSRSSVYDVIVSFVVVDSVFDSLTVDNETEDTTYFYTAQDGADSATITISVTTVPEQPPVIAAIGLITGTANVNLNFDINATDPNGTIPSFNAVNLPSGATFMDNNDGSGTFDWTPGVSDVGQHYVTFFASDNIAVDSEVVTININPAANQTPLLVPISDQTVVENEVLSFVVLASDPDGPAPFLSATGLPPGATFSDFGNGSGQFVWTPSFVQSGVYQITFYATDGQDSVSQSVLVDVIEAGNQPPIISAGTFYSLDEQQNLTFTFTASDPEGSPVTFLTSSPTSIPAGVSIVDLGNDTATFSWTPSLCQGGSNDIVLAATDGEDAGTFDLTILVNDVGDQIPILNPVGNKVVTEGQLLSVQVSSTVLAGCPVPTLGTTTLPTLANFIDSGNGRGLFVWTPGFTQGASPDSVFTITFYADDGVLPADSEVITVSVADAGNQNPVFASLGFSSISVFADTTIAFSLSAADPDSTIPTISSSNLPTGASLVDNGDGTANFVWTPDTSMGGTYNIVFDATDLDSAIGILSLEIIVAKGRGLVELAKVDGLFGTSTDTVLSCQEITLYFTATNNTGEVITDLSNGFQIYSPDPSVTWTDASLDTTGAFTSSMFFIQFIENSEVTGFGSDTVGYLGSTLGFLAGVAEDFSDTVYILTLGPLGSDFAGKQICIDSSRFGGEFWLWTTFSGKEIRPAWGGPFCFTIIDPGGNQPPVFSTALTDTTITECETISIPLAANDPDTDSSLVVFKSDSLPSGAIIVNNFDGTGSFNWTPDGRQEGSYAINITVTDGCGGTDVESFVVTVNSETAPVFNAASDVTVKACSTLTLNVSVSDFGAASAPTLSVSEVNYSEAVFTDNGDGTGVLIWNPTVAQLGDDTVLFMATDSDCGSIDTMRVVITVVADDSPTVTADSSVYNTAECSMVNVSFAAADPQGTAVVMEASDSLDSFTDNGDGTADLSWTPSSGFAGTYNIMLYATDGCGSMDSQSVSIVVALDTLPSFSYSVTRNGNAISSTNDSVFYSNGDTVVVTLTSIDPEGLTPVLSVDTLPSGAAFLDNGDGTATCTFLTQGVPKGIYRFSFESSDGCGTATASVAIIDTVLYIVTGVETKGDGSIPDDFALNQNYPNPFNPTTRITFDLAERSHVQVYVFNVLGQNIKTLVNQSLPAGSNYVVEWNGLQNNGVRVSSGIYFYKIITDQFTDTKKMVMLK